MVGFSLMHSGAGVLLILFFCAGGIWATVVLTSAAAREILSRKWVVGLLASYALACGVLAIPYGFWQRIFIDKFSYEQAVEILTYNAAIGDLRTVKAFLDRGLDINAQGEDGTALHGAAVQGELEVIEYLIAHGADVNAINPVGDSPLANAMEARKNARETQVLLIKHGAKEFRGTKEQVQRVISEQMRRHIEESERPRIE